MDTSRDRNTCVDDDTLAEWLDGDLAPDRRAAVLAHLDGCAGCRRLIAELGTSTEPPEADDPVEVATPARLGRGDRIGRLVIERVLGAGAMGVVYAATDLELGRDVAVKLLRPAAGDGPAAAEAMRREARTLARLSHPNVITVHDVDVHAGAVYLVMELVDGWTLREWLETPRAWPAIRDVLVQAARGLAAAHAAGVIHRDIKPDNVLVGRDGRVRVTDFGLARSQPVRIEGPATPGAAIETSAAGTPAYMAPELRAGAPAQLAADRYAFAVMAYEAVFGRRPSPSTPMPRRARGVPRPALRAIARGLADDPDARPALVDVAAALDHRPAITPRRALAALGLVGVAAATLALAWPTRADACDGGDDLWGDAWPARAVAAPIAERIAGYHARWREVHREACRAHQRGEESDALLDQRMACLRARRDEVAAVAAIVSSGDRDTAQRAGQIVGQLSTIDACAEAAIATLAPRPADPERRAAVDAVATQLAAVRAERDATRWGRCVELADAAIPAARAAGYAPVLAQLLFYRGFCRDDDTGAKVDLDDAMIAAEEGKDDLLRARIYTRLNHLIGFREHRYDDARRLMRFARAIMDRAGFDLDLEWVYLINLMEIVPRGDDATLEPMFARAEGLARQFPSVIVNDRLALLEAIRGNRAAESGYADIALPHHLRALELTTQAYGPSPPITYDTRCNITNDLIDLGRADEAMALIPILYVDLVAIDGPDADDSWLRANHAHALRQLHRFADALAQDRLGQVSCAKFAGPDSHTCAESYAGEALDHLYAGDYELAAAPIVRALELYGDDPPLEIRIYHLVIATFATARDGVAWGFAGLPWFFALA